MNMNGLYQRRFFPNTAAPAMQVAASQGAGGAVPRGASASMPQQEQGIDVAQLGGLLGMIKNGMTGGSEGVFNESVMPGVGQSLAAGGGTAAPAAGNLGAGVPSGGTGLGFDVSDLKHILGGLGGFGA